MGRVKNRMIEAINYCYFCREEISPEEPYKKLNLYTLVAWRKQKIIGHVECIEGDFRKGEE